MATPQQPIALPLDQEDIEKAKQEFPWRNMIPLLLYRVAHAASYIVIFPFITDMITSFNVPQNRIGLYAGMGEGVLMLTEAMAAPFWAAVADRYGRRPTMVWSFIVSVVPACLVGFSSKPWQVVVLRGIFGILSSQGITQTILTEVSNPHNRVRMFAIAAPTWHVGAVIGTVLSGELAHPYERLPRRLGGTIEIFGLWPYALPCLAVGGIGLLASFMGMVMLEETQRAPVHPLDETGESQAVKASRNLYLETLRVPNFLFITTVFCAIQLMCMAYDGIYSVYTYTSIDKGGLGLPVDIIGLVMALGSVAFVVTTPTVLPAMIDRCGMIETQRYLIFIWPLIGIALPVCHWVAGNAQGLLWPAIGVMQVIRAIGCFVWTLSEMMAMNAFDNAPHLLATGSAISLVGGAAGRAIGPALAGWIFSLSTQFEAGTLGRQAYWITYIGLTIPPVVLLRYLPKRMSTEKNGYKSLAQDENA